MLTPSRKTGNATLSSYSIWCSPYVHFSNTNFCIVCCVVGLRVNPHKLRPREKLLIPSLNHATTHSIHCIIITFSRLIMKLLNAVGKATYVYYYKRYLEILTVFRHVNTKYISVVNMGVIYR